MRPFSSLASATIMAAALLLLTTTTASAQDPNEKQIVEIQIKVLETIEEGSSLSLEVVGESNLACIIEEAIDSELQYTAPKTISLSGPRLEACLYFPADVARMLVSFSQPDAFSFLPGFYRVLYSDSTFVQCNSGVRMYNGDQQEPSCSEWPGTLEVSTTNNNKI